MRLNIIFPIFFSTIFFSICEADTLSVDMVNTYKQVAQDFKTWFNIDVNPSDQLAIGSTVATLRKDFYSKLNSCTPGVYKYPIGINHYVFPVDFDSTIQSGKIIMGVFALGISTISGSNGDKCVVDTSRKIGNGITQVHCEYSKSSLDLFNNYKLINMLAGNATVFIDNEYPKDNEYIAAIGNDLDNFRKISQQECKIIKNDINIPSSH